MVISEPVPTAVAEALSKAVRLFDDRDVWTLLGQWVAAGGLGWMRDPPGLAYLAGSGRAAECIERARRWQADGRPAIARSRSASSASDGARPSGAAPVSDFTGAGGAE
jgi:hypothetical protein